MLDQQISAFKEEAAELLSELEDSLLELEETPGDTELIAKVFRAMHTIKGSGAMFGFNDIAAFTHEIETVFDLVRNGEIPVTRELINQTLEARDHICSLLDAANGADVDLARGRELVLAIREHLPEKDDREGISAVKEEALDEDNENSSVSYRIRLRLGEDIIFSGTRPDALLRELSDLGECDIRACTKTVPLLDQLRPETCHICWDILLTTSRGINAIKDVFIFVEDDIELDIRVADKTCDQEADTVDSPILYTGTEDGQKSAQQISTEERTAALTCEAKSPHDSDTVPLREHKTDIQKREDTSSPSIRVPAGRLDTLVNLVGELVTVQARLSQFAAKREDSELTAIAEEVERLSDELRDNSLNLRMLPIGTTFSKFKRLVRDLSNELGKEIELKTIGADTEIDKTVIEKLNDPLVHLIRNSIDHGIEVPEDRHLAGKPATGTVLLKAEHRGDTVEITIKDDGKGLDREGIFAKAVEKGLIQPDAQLSDSEIFNMIFTPGFSTAAKVTGVSGRGVGMDVVKRAIETLRGTISITSEPGYGSTITIRLPLTLAIIESLLVKIADDAYVIPLSVIEECVELTQQAIDGNHGRNLIPVREKVIPYIPLRQEFAVESQPPPVQQIVITNLNGQRIGFVVDQVIGQHQSVIKSLGKMCKDVQGVSGATILGDGNVALILDINHLAQKAEDMAA